MKNSVMQGEIEVHLIWQLKKINLNLQITFKKDNIDLYLKITRKHD